MTIEQPHDDSPDKSCHQSKTVPLQKTLILDFLLLILAHILFIDELDHRNRYSTQEIQIYLIVYRSLFAEHQPAYYETCYKTIQRSWPQSLLQQKAGQFVTENKGSQLFSVLPGILEDRFYGLSVEFLEQECHHQRMNKTNSAAILETVSQTLEKRQYFLSVKRHIVIMLKRAQLIELFFKLALKAFKLTAFLLGYFCLILQKIQMHCFSIIGRRLIARFSEQPRKVKSLKNFLKTQQIVQKDQLVQFSKQDQQGLKQSHRLLYVPFVPALLLAFPCMYFLTVPTDPYFLNSCNVLQYYASGILYFNTFFTQQKAPAYFTFLIGVAAINCIPFPYSIASPLALGLFNLYLPFTDPSKHQTQTDDQKQRLKAFMFVQGLFYFFIIFIATLKAYHYFQLRGLQKKLESLQKENSEHFKKRMTVQDN